MYDAAAPGSRCTIVAPLLLHELNEKIRTNNHQRYVQQLQDLDTYNSTTAAAAAAARTKEKTFGRRTLNVGHQSDAGGA